MVNSPTETRIQMTQAFSPHGSDLFGDPVSLRVGPVADKFVFPPFTVLDARAVDWQERKRAWVSLGIAPELGRTADLLGGRYGFNSLEKIDGQKRTYNGTSIFDPVLCELVYRWFCPAGGQVVDPFAGGSVRGVVAACLGLNYWGCELRAEQVAANIDQGHQLEPRPIWVCGDAMDALDVAPLSDLVFSCPPYGDLERYSDDERDLSAMDWHAFRAAYRRVIMRALKSLKDDRFACFVVGDFRDPKGHYRNFVGDTIAAFEECGARLYNEAVLVTPLGAAGLRVSKIFDGGRKLTKTHQNVLLFVKGDWRAAAAACKPNGAESKPVK